MFRSLRSFFGRRSSRRSPDNLYRFSSEDAVHIEPVLQFLPTIGFHPTMPPEKCKEKSKEIAREKQGVHCIRQPTIGNWVVFALSAEDRAFANAMHFSDHCYDGMTATELADMIRDIVGMASDDWRVDDVEIAEEWLPPEPDGRARVQIVASPPVTSFELVLAKDFDWTLIYRLNERLPKQVTKRFAILLDGGAEIVYLEPEEVKKLNDYCGYHFFYEE